MTSKCSQLYLLLISVGWLCGCGGPTNELGRMSVSGKVTVSGKPLDHGSIEFTPTAADGKGTQSGDVIENGEYHIPESKGLPPGEYLVRIFSSEDNGAEGEAPGESSEIAKELIPADFNTDSDHKVKVEAGKENTFDFPIP